MNRSLKRRLTRMTAVALLPAAIAAGPGISTQDMAFAQLANRTNLGQISLSQQALNKSGNSAIDAYAGRLYADFDGANADLQGVDGRLGLPQPDAMDPDDERLTVQIAPLASPAAEKTYMDAQPAIYTRIIAMYRKEISDGTNAFVIAYAQRTLKTLKADQAESQSLAANYKRDAVPASAVTDGETVPVGQ